MKISQALYIMRHSHLSFLAEREAQGAFYTTTLPCR